jgi:hypothetical protein
MGDYVKKSMSAPSVPFQRTVGYSLLFITRAAWGWSLK